MVGVLQYMQKADSLSRQKSMRCTAQCKCSVNVKIHDKGGGLCGSRLSNTEIVFFVFQLIYVQRIDMNDTFSDLFTGK